MAAETQDVMPGAAAQAGEEAPACQKKVSTKGRPHKINKLARLAAMRAWTEMAIKYGEEYTMWHNAKNPNIKCKKLPRSEFIECFAKGKPCRATHSGKAASSKTN